MLKGLAHGLTRFLRTVVGGQGCHLAHVARAAGVLSLQLVQSLDNPLGSGHPSQAPACHGVGLGGTVGDDHALPHPRKLGQAVVLAHIVDVLVNLVGKHEEVVMAHHHARQSLQLVLAVDAPRGVARRADDEQLGLLGDGVLQLLRSHLEIAFDARADNDRLSTRELHHLRIAHPVGSGDDNLVSGVDQSQYGIAHPLLAARSHDNLGRSILQPVLTLQLVSDGLAEDEITWNGRIFGEVVVDGLLASLLDVVGGIEVGFANTHVDHVDTLSTHLVASLRHGQRGRRSQPVESIG